MELEAHIFSDNTDNETVDVSIRIPTKDISKLFRDTCYLALEKIREILLIKNMDDSACIDRIVDLMIQLEGEHEAWDLPPLSAALKK